MIWMGDPQTRMLSLASTGPVMRLIFRRPMPLNSVLHWNGLSAQRGRLPAAAAGLPEPNRRAEAAATIRPRFANGPVKTAIRLTAVAEFRLKSRKPTKRQIPSSGKTPVISPASRFGRQGFFCALLPARPGPRRWNRNCAGPPQLVLCCRDAGAAAWNAPQEAAAGGSGHGVFRPTGRACNAALRPLSLFPAGPGFPRGEHAPQVRAGHVASKYVVARSVAKCLSDLRTVPVA
jgi:hypothetical protein